MGNKGADFSTNNEDKYLGSVANAIIKNTKLNVVFMPWSQKQIQDGNFQINIYFKAKEIIINSI